MGTGVLNISDDGTTFTPIHGNAGGDVVGPGSATDNAIARFSGATGKLLQDSGVLIDDSDNITGIASLQAASATSLTLKTSDGEIILGLLGSGTIVNFPLLSAGTTGSPVILQPSGETNIGLTLKAAGTGDILLSPITGNVHVTAGDLFVDAGNLDVTGAIATTGNIVGTGAIGPAIASIDTTNTCIAVLQAQDTFGFFGTTSNHPIIIAVNNAEKVRILQSGEFGIGVVAPLAKLHVDQGSTSGAIPVLYLDQADLAHEMIEFNTTIQTGGPIEAIAAKSLTTTHFIKITIPGGLTRYIPCGTIA